MFHKNRIKMACLSGFIGLLGCLSVVGCASSTSAESNDELSNYDVDINTSVIVNESDLNAAITYKDEIIEIEAPSARITGQTSFKPAATSFTLKLVAEVPSPVIDGNTVQATSIVLKKDLAYISYNTAGAVFSGALDIVDISKPNKPQIKSRTLFKNMDINDVFYRGKNVYLAQALDSGVSGKNSRISKLPIKSNAPDFDNEIASLINSFAGTSVYAYKDNLYVTSGSTGGLYEFNNNTLSEIQFTSIADARWVSGKGGKIFTLSGGTNQGVKILTYSTAGSSQDASFSITGAATAESKSVIEGSSRYGFVAGNEDGVSVYKLSTGARVQHLPLPTITDPDITAASNSVTIYKDLLFISNGEAGIYVAQNTTPLTSVSADTDMALTVVGKLSFGSTISVNHVSYKGTHLFVAAGLGGVKILTVSNAADKGEEDDDDEEDD
ncbi:MAG: hypothetical protein ACI9BD_000827 [Candidatus Marinamargulisbacteria bacterium]|jgi:hypothetical protein